MSTVDREERISRLGYALFQAMVDDNKGCDWTESAEAIGFLMKIHATAVSTLSDTSDVGESATTVPQETGDKIVATVIDAFNKGWEMTAEVTFK